MSLPLFLFCVLSSRKIFFLIFLIKNPAFLPKFISEYFIISLYIVNAFFKNYVYVTLLPECRKAVVFVYLSWTQTANQSLLFILCIFKNNFIYLFIGCATSSLLWGLFSSCGVRASHCSGLSCCRAQTPGQLGLSNCSSWALEHRLNSCGAWLKLLRGIFPDQGSNLCLLHWQADS